MGGRDRADIAPRPLLLINTQTGDNVPDNCIKINKLVHMENRTKRIQISLTEHQYNIIHDLSEVTKSPKSKLIYEFLELAFPTLEILLDNLKRVKELDSDLKEQLSDNLDTALKSNQDAIEMLNEVLTRNGQ